MTSEDVHWCRQVKRNEFGRRALQCDSVASTSGTLQSSTVTQDVHALSQVDLKLDTSLT